MKFLTITCFSAAALQLAVIITRNLTWIPDEYDEIALCRSVSIRSAEVANTSSVTEMRSLPGECKNCDERLDELVRFGRKESTAFEYRLYASGY